MSKENCRLCLCSADTRAGAASIMDKRFEDIIKSVFRFALPTCVSLAKKKYDLPVLVCFQCSNTIRNFHYFSEHVKANQKKIQCEMDENGQMQGKISTDTNQQMQKPETTVSNLSLDELIHHIKRESQEDETSPITVNDIELNFEEPNHGIDGNPPASESVEVIDDSPFTLTQPQTCVTKGELVETLDNMETRVNSVTKQLCLMKRNLAIDHRRQWRSRTDRRTSFEFSPITKEEELDSFNQQLNDTEYRINVLDWLDVNIDVHDSNNRMHQSLDLMFNRAFLAGCNWSGVSRSGGTDTNMVTNTHVNQFLKKKLPHAKERVHIVCRKTSCHKVPRNRKHQ